jgi:UDP-N-acetylglucosamine--N-acetylmuramyl-(pentapeptide) pyrophosphoryl-undecaprenol N-acetylglucosamine transferase
MKKLKFIISGGGTGGHIYPAIAIANELKIKYPDCDILFVGAKDKMEMQKVPQAGYERIMDCGVATKINFSKCYVPCEVDF